jgi:hypothetical protein
MNFSEAMDKLKSGSKVTRKDWPEGLCFMMKDGAIKSFRPVIQGYSYNEEIMLSDGWLVKGNDKQFSFAEIVPFLLKGTQARLSNWNKEMFIYFDQHDKELVFRKIEESVFTPDFMSFVAEDWYIYE